MIFHGFFFHGFLVEALAHGLFMASLLKNLEESFSRQSFSYNVYNLNVLQHNDPSQLYNLDICLQLLSNVCSLFIEEEEEVKGGGRGTGKGKEEEERRRRKRKRRMLMVAIRKKEKLLERKKIFSSSPLK